MAGRREELVSSLRLAAREEGRVFGGGLLALASYALWVGLSGAALTFAADALNVSLSPQPWSDAKTGIVAVALVAWVLAPALLATRLLIGQLTNTSGNIAQRYRYDHPAVLLAPSAVLLVVAVAATVALDGPPWPVFVVLVFAALFLLVRTVAYGYRVFSLSVPWALASAAALSFLSLAVALLTGGAVLAGRQEYLVSVTEGVVGTLGVGGAVWVADGGVTVAGATLPAAVTVAVAVPVGLSVLYLVVQTLASVVNRTREPEVPRSELRTGQRYPEFTRPTTTVKGTAGGSSSGARSTAPSSSVSTDSTGSPTSGSSQGPSSSPTDPSPGTAGSAAAERAGDSTDDSPTVDTGPADPQVTDDVSNTRVYTPPGDDDDGEDPLSSGAGPGAESKGAGTDGGSTGSSAAGASDAAPTTENDACPECGESQDPDAVFCSACGAALE